MCEVEHSIEVGVENTHMQLTIYCEVAENKDFNNLFELVEAISYLHGVLTVICTHMWVTFHFC